MKKKNIEAITIRHYRIRKKVIGTKERPRISLYRGLKNLHAQLIDDKNNKIILSISTGADDFKKQLRYGGNVKAAISLGQMLAKKAKEAGIEKAVFDRGGYLYHGRIKAFADAARKEGLIF
ncbi:MAG: 50S ribosomal protein L18 [Candidatus Omnitrophota bacterium]